MYDISYIAAPDREQACIHPGHNVPMSDLQAIPECTPLTPLRHHGKNAPTLFAFYFIFQKCFY